MDDNPLQGLRVLVVEDEYLLAEEICSALARAQAIVVGPCATVADALTRIDSNQDIDLAILDTNLQGEMVYPVADRLQQKGVPYVFATGYDANVLPDRLRPITRCLKPIAPQTIIRALSAYLAQNR